MGHEVQTERLMNRALRCDFNKAKLLELDLETMAAVAACYNPPYQSYGKIRAYIEEYGHLPPAEYRKPRHLWQRVMTPGTLCRKCANLQPNARVETDCPMLQLRGAAGMQGSVIKCSEFEKKPVQHRRRAAQWPGDEEMR